MEFSGRSFKNESSQPVEGKTGRQSWKTFLAEGSNNERAVNKEGSSPVVIGDTAIMLSKRTTGEGVKITGKVIDKEGASPVLTGDQAIMLSKQTDLKKGGKTTTIQASFAAPPVHQRGGDGGRENR